jgi:hypothetical protein
MRTCRLKRFNPYAASLDESASTHQQEPVSSRALSERVVSGCLDATIPGCRLSKMLFSEH